MFLSEFGLFSFIVNHSSFMRHGSCFTRLLVFSFLYCFMNPFVARSFCPLSFLFFLLLSFRSVRRTRFAFTGLGSLSVGGGVFSL